MKVYIVITSKVFADFRFESPISIDFQSEIPTLLAPKSANTFHESLEFFRARQSKQSKQFNSKIILMQVEMSFLKCSDEKSSGKFKYHLVLSKSVHGTFFDSNFLYTKYFPKRIAATGLTKL